MKYLQTIGIAFILISLNACKYKCSCSYNSPITGQQENPDLEYKGTITRAEALVKCQNQENEFKGADPNAVCVLE